MRKGFTIIELLVASLLLGLLVTILTMVFNQSSVAWRLGTAGVAKMDDIRGNIAELRDEADNAYVWNNEVCRLIGLWDAKGNLRKRAVAGENNSDFAGAGDANADALRANILIQKIGSKSNLRPRDFRPVNVGQTRANGTAKTYFVNVMSAGPDREWDTYDDIWSFPDDFD